MRSKNAFMEVPYYINQEFRQWLLQSYSFKAR